MYSRKIDDQVLTFSASGWTYNFLFVLYDFETKSMWYPMQKGMGPTGIGGVYADRTMIGIPSTETYWSSWKKTHPDTKILKGRVWE